MTNKDLANLIFPDIDKDVSYYENLYPERNLKEGSVVSRFAPSPTGFVHMGSLFSAFLASKVAKDSDGVFYVRIEDTDQERKVENGVENIIRDLTNFGIEIDEGVIGEEKEKGQYGPYIQSNRKEIYQTYAKHLLEEGLAYPCFCSPEELEEIRNMQEINKEQIGYYGSFAKCRTLSIEEQVKRIQNGEKYVIRLKSPGDINHKVKVKDLIKGEIEFPENNLDIVIIKSDGLPTYHFAHAVDDHLMHTTCVVRGDEWVSSLPIHVQLFNVLGFKTPKYAHLSPIMVQDGNSRRKLSKRKDAYAAISYYHELGIPNEAVKLYLMTIANSNFEAWYQSTPNGKLEDFKFDFKKVSSSGSLFDMDKLLNISKNYISFLSKDELYSRVLEWSKTYDQELYDLITKYKEETISFLNIEREQKKPRKDYASYSEIKKGAWYMYDELFDTYERNYELPDNVSLEEAKKIIKLYISKYYDAKDSEEEWFNRMKEMSKGLGYATDMKDYHENPDKYKGSVADISNVIRVVFTTKKTTPNLYNILKILGTDRMQKRIEMFEK